jgi:hypothetical protein
MRVDEMAAPGDYRTLLKSICSFDKRMCQEMTPVIQSIIGDEKRHAKVVKEALDAYCVEQGD